MHTPCLSVSCEPNKFIMIISSQRTPCFPHASGKPLKLVKPSISIVTFLMCTREKDFQLRFLSFVIVSSSQLTTETIQSRCDIIFEEKRKRRFTGREVAYYALSIRFQRMVTRRWRFYTTIRVLERPKPVTPLLERSLAIVRTKILDTLRWLLCEVKQKEFNCGKIVRNNEILTVSFPPA